MKFKKIATCEGVDVYIEYPHDEAKARRIKNCLNIIAKAGEKTPFDSLFGKLAK